MPDKDTAKEFEESLRKAEEIKAFLDEVYYNPEIATLHNKPVISMLSTAAEYLTVNLGQLRRQYLHETGE